ncbi:MAG: cytochrome c [Alphaproteobacteria bacterium]|nr:cytochrome c [Alphaproteobacteria bacterium]
MKTKLLAAAALAALLLGQSPAAAQVSHGGRSAEAGAARLELVIGADAIDLYVSDAAGKPLPADAMSGKVTLLAPGGKLDVTLAPAGGNRLSGKLSAAIPPGTAAVVNLAGGAQPIAARFAKDESVAAAHAGHGSHEAHVAAGGKPASGFDGAALYVEHCSACHGDKLQGQPNWQVRLPSGELPAPPLDASGHGWHHSDQQLFDMIKFGVAKFAPPGYKTQMLPFGGTLSDAQIRAILDQIKASWPAEIRARQAAVGQPTAKPAAGGHAGH